MAQQEQYSPIFLFFAIRTLIGRPPFFLTIVIIAIDIFVVGVLSSTIDHNFSDSLDTSSSYFFFRVVILFQFVVFFVLEVQGDLLHL